MPPWTIHGPLARRGKHAPESFTTEDRRQAEHYARRGWEVTPALGDLPPERKQQGYYVHAVLGHRFAEARRLAGLRGLKARNA